MRRFEFVQGSSAKFWMADAEGKTFIVVYGRLGTDGQRKDKTFPSEDAARRELDKKIAEKLKEGYHEVAANAAANAPKGAKGAAAAAPRLALPARVQAVEPTAETVQAATAALSALQGALGGRSWVVGQKARRARRSLEAIAGFNPVATKGTPRGLKDAFESLMARVVAAKGTPRLPLRVGLSLLLELDVAAFERALEIWRQAGAGTAGAVAVLLRQIEALEDPELTLRLGALLADRPDEGASTEAGWTRRWRTLQPHLETHLIAQGTTLKNYLQKIDAQGDARIAQRVSRMAGRR